MPKASNPYIYGKMITDVDNFYGRANFLSTLVDYSHKMQDVSILGKRRIGKSSLLLHYINTIRQNDDFGDLIPIYLDFQDERVQSVKGFTERISKKIASEVGTSDFTHPNPSTLSKLQDSIEEMFSKKKIKVLLCIDELEVVTRYPNEFDNNFFETMRSLGQTEYLGLFIASEYPLSELCAKNNISSPFHNIFATTYLGLMTLDEARRLIITPSTRMGKRFSEKEVSYVLENAGQHPFYTQMLCHQLFEYKKRDNDVDFKLLDSKFALESWPHFRQLWLHLSENEKNAVLYRVNLRSLKPAEITNNLLFSYGILTASGNLFSPIFEKWVISEAPAIIAISGKQSNKENDIHVIEQNPSTKNGMTISPDTQKVIVAATIGLLTFLVLVFSLSVIAWWLPDYYSSIVLETRLFFATIVGFVLAYTGYVKAPDFLDWLKRMIGK